MDTPTLDEIVNCERITLRELAVIAGRDASLPLPAGPAEVEITALKARLEEVEFDRGHDLGTIDIIRIETDKALAELAPALRAHLDRLVEISAIATKAVACVAGWVPLQRDQKGDG